MSFGHRGSVVIGKARRSGALVGRRQKALVDALEGRTFFSASVLALPAMIKIEETGKISSASGAVNYKVRLSAGEMLSMDVNTTSAAPSNLKLSVAKAGGRQAFSADDGTDPVTGQFTRDPSGVFKADADGVYTISVANSGVPVDGVAKPTKTSAVTFSLDLERYAVSQTLKTATAPAMWDDAGNDGSGDGTTNTATQITEGAADEWTWVSGNTLYVASADGSGYGITSDWQQAITTNDDGTKSSTYTTAGNETIEVTMPDDPRYDKKGKLLPTTTHVDTITLNSPMTVTTQASMTGDKVGMVSDMSFGQQFATLPSDSTPTVVTSSVNSARTTAGSGGLGTISRPAIAQADTAAATAQSVLNDFLSKYGISVAGPGTNYGVALGSQLGYLNFPLIASHAYIYLSKNTQTSVTFGGVQASKGDGANNVTLAIDISNPALFVSAGSTFAFGASVNGIIPYIPTASNYTGPTFSGHLWGSVSGIQVGDTPATVSGTITLNIDANGDGVPFNFNKDASGFFKPGGLASNILGDIKVGTNGTMSIGTKIKGIDLSLPVATASLGYAPATPTYALVTTTTTTIYVVGLPVTVSTSSSTPTTAGAKAPATTASMTGNTYFGSRVVTSYAISTGAAPAAIQLAGTSVNPLKGTPLESFFSGEQFSIKAGSSGYNATDFKNNFSADLSNMGSGVTILGYKLGTSARTLAVHLDASHVSVRGSMPMFSGQATVSGDIDITNGSFLMTANYAGTIPFIPASSILNQSSASITFANNYFVPGVTIYGIKLPGYTLTGLAASINLGFDYSYAGFGIYGNVAGSVKINPGNNSYSGSLSAGAGVHTIFGDVGASASASVSNTGVNVSVSAGILGSVGFTIPLK